MRSSFAIAVGMTACLASLVMADPGTGGKGAPVTVGGFVRQVAAATDGEPRSLEQARATLLRLGSTIKFDPSAPLTEAFVVGLAADLGVSVLPSQVPSSQVTPGRAASMAGLIALSAERHHGSGDPLPTQCLTSVNRGSCVNCCKATGAVASDCAHFCQANVPPPPSTPEPQP